MKTLINLLTEGILDASTLDDMSDAMSKVTPLRLQQELKCVVRGHTAKFKHNVPLSVGVDVGGNIGLYNHKTYEMDAELFDLYKNSDCDTEGGITIQWPAIQAGLQISDVKPKLFDIRLIDIVKKPNVTITGDQSKLLTNLFDASPQVLATTTLSLWKVPLCSVANFLRGPKASQFLSIIIYITSPKDVHGLTQLKNLKINKLYIMDGGYLPRPWIEGVEQPSGTKLTYFNKRKLNSLSGLVRGINSELDYDDLTRFWSPIIKNNPQSQIYVYDHDTPSYEGRCYKLRLVDDELRWEDDNHPLYK